MGEWDIQKASITCRDCLSREPTAVTSDGGNMQCTRWYHYDRRRRHLAGHFTRRLPMSTLVAPVERYP